MKTVYSSVVSLWSACLPHSRRNADVRISLSSYCCQRRNSAAALDFATVDVLRSTCPCATMRTWIGRSSASSYSLRTRTYRLGLPSVRELSRACQPSTSLLVLTARLYVDQLAGGHMRDSIHVFWRYASSLVIDSLWAVSGRASLNRLKAGAM